MKTSTFYFLLSLPIFALIGLFYFMCWLSLHNSCIGHLKLAGDSSTVELAQKELGKAIEALEKRNITKGSSCVIYHTPECNISYWYDNLKSMHNELTNNKTVEPNVQLLKLRQVVLDEDGTVTYPPNLLFYPSQKLIWFSYFLAFCVAAAFLCLSLSHYDKGN